MSTANVAASPHRPTPGSEGAKAARRPDLIPLPAQLNCDTAVLDVGRMSEADRPRVAAGMQAADLMENAGNAVAREIVLRCSIRPTTLLCGPGNNGMPLARFNMGLTVGRSRKS